MPRGSAEKNALAGAERALAPGVRRARAEAAGREGAARGRGTRSAETHPGSSRRGSGRWQAAPHRRSPPRTPAGEEDAPRAMRAVGFVGAERRTGGFWRTRAKNWEQVGGNACRRRSRPSRLPCRIYESHASRLRGRSASAVDRCVHSAENHCAPGGIGEQRLRGDVIFVSGPMQSLRSRRGAPSSSRGERQAGTNSHWKSSHLGRPAQRTQAAMISIASWASDAPHQAPIRALQPAGGLQGHWRKAQGPSASRAACSSHFLSRSHAAYYQMSNAASYAFARRELALARGQPDTATGKAKRRTALGRSSIQQPHRLGALSALEHGDAGRGSRSTERGLPCRPAGSAPASRVSATDELTSAEFVWRVGTAQ